MDINRLEQLLVESKYDRNETNYLINSFRNGFDLGYRGEENVTKTAPNLILRVGNHTILWNKVMKEVKFGRFAGPFDKIPFKNYIQSPIGLVPKDGGKETRLIFHLSYPRDGDSVNSQMLRQFCSVKYPSFDDAIRCCLKEMQNDESLMNELKLGKSDMRSAFCNLGMCLKHFKYLVMKAKSPIDGKIYYFVDKCLPFRASISCAHFQRFSNAISHIIT